MKPNKPQPRTMLVSVVAALFLLVPSFALSQEKPQRKFELQAASPAFWKLIPKDAKLEGNRHGLRLHRRSSLGQIRLPSHVSDEENQQNLSRLLRRPQRKKLIALGDPDGNTYDRQLRLIDNRQRICAQINSNHSRWKIHRPRRPL